MVEFTPKRALSPEQEAFFAMARVELARAQAQVACLDATVYGWARRAASGDLCGAEVAVNSKARCDLDGAKAAVAYWAKRVPWERDGRQYFVDTGGQLQAIRLDPSIPQPQQCRS